MLSTFYEWNRGTKIMKTTLKIGLVFIVSILIVFIIYIAIDRNNGPEIVRNEEVPDISDKAQNIEKRNTDDSLLENIVHTSRQELVVNEDTIYLHAKYDVNEDEEEYYRLALPASWIGMDKEMLETAIYKYKNAPSDEDVARGFIDISLESFSPEQVVVRTLYDKYASHAEERYYVKNPDGYVTIYYPNPDVLYFETSIVTIMLPQELQDEIEKGKYFTSQEQLFHFLESYTS